MNGCSGGIGFVMCGGRCPVTRLFKASVWYPREERNEIVLCSSAEGVDGDQAMFRS